MKFEVSPEGDLINCNTVRKIEIQRGQVIIHYINGAQEKFTLDAAWRKFLKRLSVEASS